MKYTPTKEDLEEMGFQGIATYDNGWVLGRYYIDKLMQLPYIEFNPGYDGWFIFNRNSTLSIYPQSRSDIEALIRLFTNPKYATNRI